MHKILRHFIVFILALKNGEKFLDVVSNGFKKLFRKQDYFIPPNILSQKREYNLLLNYLNDSLKCEQINYPVKFICIIFYFVDIHTIGDLQRSIKHNHKINPNCKILIITEDVKDLRITFPDIEVDKKFNLKYSSETTLILLLAGDIFNEMAFHALSKIIQKNKYAQILLFDDDISSVDGFKLDPRLKPSFNYTYWQNFNYIGYSLAIRNCNYDQPITFDNLDSAINNIISGIHNSKYEYDNVYYPVISMSKVNRSYSLKLNSIQERSYKPVDGLISIIIPFKDKVELLASLIESVLLNTTYNKFEIILADNRSQEKQTLEYLKLLESQHDNIKVIKIDCEFNFSKINNIAFGHCNGQFVLFLNNDTKVITKDWLKTILKNFESENVGAVGPKLLYEDNTIQHAGIGLGIGDFAGHYHRYLHDDQTGYMNRAIVKQEVSAITGACLCTLSRIFSEIGTFDEVNLAVAYNDVDFCLRVKNAGFKIIYEPNVKLYHYESKTRLKDKTKSEKKRYQKELDYMRKKWGLSIRDDEYYHPYLSTTKEDFSIQSKFPRIQ